MPVPDFSPGEVLTAAAMDSIGLWKVGEFTASGTSRALVCDNVFTSAYTNYRVIVQMRAASNTNRLFLLYINTAGSNVTTGYFGTAYGQDYAGGGTGFSVANTSAAHYIGWLPNSSNVNLYAAFDVYDPLSATQHTGINGSHSGLSSGFSWLGGSIVGEMNTTGAYRGLRFDNDNASNLTGTVRVYGYRN
jgi:hypothetical protein